MMSHEDVIAKFPIGAVVTAECDGTKVTGQVKRIYLDGEFVQFANGVEIDTRKLPADAKVTIEILRPTILVRVPRVTVPWDGVSAYSNPLHVTRATSSGYPQIAIGNNQYSVAVMRPEKAIEFAAAILAAAGIHAIAPTE